MHRLMRGAVRALIAALAAVVVAALAGNAAATTSYTITDLSAVGPDGTAAVLTENDQVVGQRFFADEDNTFRALSWTRAVGIVDLGTLGGRDSFANDVNEGSAGVGGRTVSSGDTHAFVRTQADGMLDRTVAVATSRTYKDGTGENPAAPDISTVVVSNDDDRFVSFQIQFSNRTDIGPTEVIHILLDADQQRATGEPPLGFDYDIQFYGREATLWRWNATANDWSLAPSTTLTSHPAPSSLTLRVNANELGQTSFFRFIVEAGADIDGPNPQWDAAPNPPALWLYGVTVAAALRIASLVCTPNPVVGGKLMTAKAKVLVTRGGAAEQLGPTTHVTWTATAGRLRLKPRSTSMAPNGNLTSTWKVPTTMRGKSIRISVTVAVEDVTVTRTRVYRIR